MENSVGILVHGNNHFVVRGPLPDPETARALAQHWSIIHIGATPPSTLDKWQIITREFRENLTWQSSYLATVKSPQPSINY